MGSKAATAILGVFLAMASVSAFGAGPDGSDSGGSAPKIASGKGLVPGAFATSTLDDLFQKKLRKLAEDVLKERLEGLLKDYPSAAVRLTISDAVNAITKLKDDKLAEGLTSTALVFTLTYARSQQRLAQEATKLLLQSFPSNPKSSYQSEAFVLGFARLGIFETTVAIDPTDTEFLRKMQLLDLSYLEMGYHLFNGTKALHELRDALDQVEIDLTKDSPEQKLVGNLKTKVEALEKNLQWLADHWGRDLESVYRQLAIQYLPDEADETAITAKAADFRAVADSAFGPYPVIKHRIAEIVAALKKGAADNLVGFELLKTIYEQAVPAGIEKQGLIAVLETLEKHQYTGDVVTQLLDYLKTQHPFSSYCEIPVPPPAPLVTSKTCPQSLQALALALEDVPNHLVVNEKEPKYEFNVATYLGANLPRIQESFTLNRWSFYFAVSQTFANFDYDGGDCPGGKNKGKELACADGQLTYYHDKVGVRYHWDTWRRFSTPVYANLYVGGLLYKIEPRGEHSYNGTFNDAFIYGVDFVSFYVRRTIEFNVGWQKIDRTGGDTIELWVVGLALPLSEYFAELSEQ